jgi:hypothetical protein
MYIRGFAQIDGERKGRAWMVYIINKDPTWIVALNSGVDGKAVVKPSRKRRPRRSLV